MGVKIAGAVACAAGLLIGLPLAAEEPGQIIWAEELSPDFVEGMGVALDPVGNLVVAGYGGGPVWTSIAVAKYTGDGSRLCRRSRDERRPAHQV